MILSAARSQLFNQVLGARQCRHLGQGDSGRCDVPCGVAAAVHVRRRGSDDRRQAGGRLDVHPTGPLCSRPAVPLQVEADARLNEERAGRGAVMDRGADAPGAGCRPSFRCVWWRTGWTGELGRTIRYCRFDLVAGAFATAVLREIVRSHDADKPIPIPDPLGDRPVEPLSVWWA